MLEHDFVAEATEGIIGDALITPYPYQAEAFSAILGEFSRGTGSTLLVLPTGCGKTVNFMMVARCEIEEGGRVLVLAHRDELIQQAANAAPALGLAATVEKAGEHARPDFTLGGGHFETLSGLAIDAPCDPKLVVASVQTLQGKRLKAWPPGHFSLVIVDEGHHAYAKSYRNILEHLKPGRTLGVTATWMRGNANKKGVVKPPKEPIVGPGCVFETLAFEYPMTEAVERGYLARPIFEMLECNVDLSALRVSGDDLNESDMEAALLPHVQELVSIIRPKIEGKRALIFTPQVKSADAVASALRSVGVSAESLSGECKDRGEVVAAFRAGRYRHLVNCQLFTEGADFPFVDAVVMMRATKSLTLFTQMVGRGTRRGKPHCYVYGFNWQTFDHKLIHPVEIFQGPGVDKATLDEAAKIVDSGECVDLMEAVKVAGERVKERARLKLAVKDKVKKVKSHRFDPLALGDGDIRQQPKWSDSSASLQIKASGPQVGALERFGFKPGEVVDWSKARAGAVLDSLVGRIKKGLSSKKQIDFLKSLGYPHGAKLTHPEASAAIDFLRSAPRGVRGKLGDADMMAEVGKRLREKAG